MPKSPTMTKLFLLLSLCLSVSFPMFRVSARWLSSLALFNLRVHYIASNVYNGQKPQIIFFRIAAGFQSISGFPNVFLFTACPLTFGTRHQCQWLLHNNVNRLRGWLDSLNPRSAFYAATPRCTKSSYEHRLSPVLRFVSPGKTPTGSRMTAGLSYSREIGG